jgi:hypothetical protein
VNKGTICPGWESDRVNGGDHKNGVIFCAQLCFFKRYAIGLFKLLANHQRISAARGVFPTEDFHHTLGRGS